MSSLNPRQFSSTADYGGELESVKKAANSKVRTVSKERKEAILAAIDNNYCTLPGIKKFLNVPASENIFDDVDDMVVSGDLARENNGDLTGYFRRDKVPARFWREGNGKVGVEYAAPKTESAPKKFGREKIDISEADVEKYASEGFKIVRNGGIHEKLGISYSGLYNKFNQTPQLKDAYRRGAAKFEASKAANTLSNLEPKEPKEAERSAYSAFESKIIDGILAGHVGFNDLLKYANLGAMFIPTIQSLLREKEIVIYDRNDVTFYRLAGQEEIEHEEIRESPVVEPPAAENVAEDNPKESTVADETERETTGVAGIQYFLGKNYPTQDMTAAGSEKPPAESSHVPEEIAEVPQMQVQSPTAKKIDWTPQFLQELAAKYFRSSKASVALGLHKSAVSKHLQKNTILRKAWEKGQKEYLLNHEGVVAGATRLKTLRQPETQPARRPIADVKPSKMISFGPGCSLIIYLNYNPFAISGEMRDLVEDVLTNVENLEREAVRIQETWFGEKP